MRIQYQFILALLLLAAGCGQDFVASENESNESAVHNFMLVVQCWDTPDLPINITGDARLAMDDFLHSNCSIHGSGGHIAVRCPQDRSALEPRAMPPWLNFPVNHS